MDKISVLTEELNHIRDALSRTMGSIYNLYGVIVPASLGALALFGEDALGKENIDVLGFMLILVVSAALSYSNALWIEAHQYLRYMYLELIPRMYRIVELNNEVNMFEYISVKREPYTWRPVLIFQLILILGVALMGLGAIVKAFDGCDSERAKFLAVIATVILATSAYTSFIIQKSAKSLFAELKNRANKIIPDKSPD